MSSNLDYIRDWFNICRQDLRSLSLSLSAGDIGQFRGRVGRWVQKQWVLLNDDYTSLSVLTQQPPWQSRGQEEGMNGSSISPQQRVELSPAQPRSFSQSPFPCTGPRQREKNVCRRIVPPCRVCSPVRGANVWNRLIIGRQSPLRLQNKPRTAYMTGPSLPLGRRVVVGGGNTDGRVGPSAVTVSAVALEPKSAATDSCRAQLSSPSTWMRSTSV